ncbi:glycogen/starch synthase [Candidatus Kuenenbacteria bacterium]|nr:glycogen/starch synthase [Candidatus Kuenenbacteria bacterium]
MNNKLNKKLKVLFVASEVAPIAKVGGLADVVGALPKALKKLDVDVKIIIPKYGMIDEKKYPMKKIASEIKIPFYNQEELINIYSCFLPTHPESLTINSENKCGNKNFSTHKNLCFNTGRRGLPETQIEIYLIENLKYLSQDGVYLTVDASSSGEINECQRFIFFTKCVAEIFLPLTFFRKKVRGSSQQQATEYSRKCGINWQPNIFHCHDWSTGFLPLLIKMQVKNQKTLFTIHNFAYQGKYNPQEIFKMLNLKETDWPTLKERTKNQFEDLNAVQQAILNANLINTVSPTYAQEILTKEFGEGLENDLKKRKNDLFGILNGIDTTFFNPMTDLNLKKITD